MKTYDITDKMSFENSQKIKIKNITVDLQTNAKVVIQVVDLMDKQDSLGDIIKAYELLFNEKDREKIDKLNLNTEDFMELISTSIALATGGDPDEKNEGNE